MAKDKDKAAEQPAEVAGGEKSKPDVKEPVAALPVRTFTCSIPKDPLAPTLTVEAATPGDAERVYKEQAGIIATEHPIQVSGE